MSLWEKLAKLSSGDREKFLNDGQKPKNTGKTDKKAFGSVVYEATTLSAPKGGHFIWNPGWDEDE